MANAIPALVLLVIVAIVAAMMGMLAELVMMLLGVGCFVLLTSIVGIVGALLGG